MNMNNHENNNLSKYNRCLVYAFCIGKAFRIIRYCLFDLQFSVGKEEVEEEEETLAGSNLEEKILADSKLEQVRPTTQQGELMAPALVQAENAEQLDTPANSSHHMDSV